LFVRREGDLDLEVIELALDEDVPVEVRNQNLQNMIGLQLNSYQLLVPWSDFFKELCLIFGGRCNGAS